MFSKDFFFLLVLLDSGLFSRFERKDGGEGVVVSASLTSLSPGKKSSGISRYLIDFRVLQSTQLTLEILEKISSIKIIH